MTGETPAALTAAARLEALLRPRTIRECAERIHASGLRGELAHWAVDEAALPAVVERVERVTRAAYPDVRKIPYHGRLRHFGAGGVDRASAFEARIASLAPDERLAARFELVITSVLLDAGAGARWAYRDASGRSHARSEGLAVASYDLFVGGGLSDDPSAAPLRADEAALAAFDEAKLARAFQVGPDNPLVGLAGRAAVLRKLGQVVREAPAYFGAAPRLGHLGAFLAAAAVGGELPASAILDAVLRALGPIWPGRETLAGTSLGDVWRHSSFGLVPFHKLSQWLTYSLCEPLEAHGLTVTGLEELTGLAEYRNGGLFVDGGVLVPRHVEVLTRVHPVSSDVVIEWRALTLALLDRTAARLRGRLGLSAEELPLAKVLEGGTWSAGREIAAEKRAGGPPPVQVQSDGTVF